MKRTPQEIYKAREPATRAPTKVLYRGRTASIGRLNGAAMRRTAEEAESLCRSVERLRGTPDLSRVSPVVSKR